MISRREFMKIGAGSLAGLAAFDILGQDLFGAEKMNNTQLYLQLFGVDEADLQRVFREALAAGGDYCDIYFQHKVQNEFVLEDNIINSATTTLDRGVGIRVLKGDQTGYSFTEEITAEAMKRAARTAGMIAGSKGKVKEIELSRRQGGNYYKMAAAWADVNAAKKAARIMKLNEEAFSIDARIKKCKIGYCDWNSRIMVANSAGAIVCDEQPYIRVSVSCVGEHNGKREEGFVLYAQRRGPEVLDSDDVKGLAKEAVVRTVALFDAVKPAGGEMEVVIAAGDMGVLLHEAIGHGLEADFNRKELSTFSDKMGKKVAENFVTIVDDGTCEHCAGAINIDDEGSLTEQTVLVRDGVLERYMHDHISSEFYKSAMTGNGRRESFRHSPMPRMRTTYMLGGPHDPEEIIRSVKYGLYAQRVGNGEVAIGAGDFTFYIVAGRLIENGRLTSVVKDVNIIGKGPQVLRDICMVGNDLKLGTRGGMCGKNGQWAPVTCGMPTVKVRKMTVGSA